MTKQDNKTDTPTEAPAKQASKPRNWWPIVIGGIAIGLFLHVLSDYVSDKASRAAEQAVILYINENPMPRVATLDIERTTERFKAESNDDLVALRGIAILIKLLERDGYMVIDSRSVFAVPSQYVIKNFSLDELEQIAERRGINLDAEMDGLVEKAVQDAQLKTRELQSLIRQMEAEANL